ncbi:MAG: NAD(P)/FAD-dependent oxidoreductase [Limisphaerales bacterium]
MPPETPRSVAIVGGGFTGLVSALRLSRAGMAVTLFERGKTLGGLAGDFELQGTRIEKAYHHIFRTDRDILDLVNELGLEDHLIWRRSSMGIYRDGKIFPFMSPMDLLRFKPCSLLARLRLGAVVFYLQKKKNWREFAGIPAFEWMRRACGEQAMEAVWGPLLRGKFDRYYSSISMAWLWARIHVRANSRDSSSAEKLGYFRGSFSVITQKLEEELVKNGVKILKNTSVEAMGEGRLKIAGEWQLFDRCVFTGPSSVLAQLLPRDNPALEAYRAKLESIEYLGAVCLVFASEQDVGDVYWLNINEPGAPFLVFINHTKLIERSLYRDKYVYYIGSYQPHDSELFKLPDEQIVSRWFDYLKTIHPQFDANQVIEKHLFKLKYAQHIVDTDYQSKIPGCQTPVPGLFLANFSQIYPEDRGTNYSIRDGNKIAAIIRESFNSGK